MMTFTDLIQDLPTHIQDKLNELKKLRERPDFHPEESAFEHVRIVTTRAIKLGDPDLIMSAIFHDIHKTDTMQINPKTGWPTSPGHDAMAQETIESDSQVQDFIKRHGGDVDAVAVICGQHMRIHQYDNMRPVKQQAMQSMPCFNKIKAFGNIDDMLQSDMGAIFNAQDFLL